MKCLKDLSKNSYCLLPENFVYCLLKSDDIETREVGLKVVKKVKAAKTAIPRITNLYDLQINIDADRWQPNLLSHKYLKIKSSLNT